MKQFINVVSILTGAMVSVFPHSVHADSIDSTMDKDIYTNTVLAIDGTPVSMQEFAGQVILLVNTASKCGYTGQLKELEDLYATFKGQGLVVLGFPSNDFGNQEPGTNEEIELFCKATYGVSFPLFSKISVRGDTIDPLFKQLTEENSNPELNGTVRWNFEKFLIGRKGQLRSRFSSGVTPKDSSLVEAIKRLLQE